ncbi:hypothetical protein N7533_006395 [Penicillium manginii]|uniref:uncharacterized protein n=1 Tax=Penicillium manginii TaxID=203109 RepID=UPI0025489889|nr:uncharacterized protein N7533_006395 [Penicillium manginii]KAJ5756852.1 hypothetical protein N7533_006395 [Penicillium manginii]
MNCTANFAALVINNPNFARYARKPQDSLWPQVITIPVGFAITSFIGIIVSSSSSVIFGKAVWNPLTLWGVMVSDYYLMRKGYLDIEDLYSARKDSLYYGVYGVSWHGYTAYFCGILINIVGFAGAVGVDVPIGIL